MIVLDNYFYKDKFSKKPGKEIIKEHYLSKNLLLFRK